MSIKKQIRTAGDTTARHGHIFVGNFQRVAAPRILMHFEQGKNGRIQGYRYFETTGVFPQAGQARSKSPIVYLGMSTDNKWNQSRSDVWGIDNPVGDSNQALFGLSQLSPEKYRETFGMDVAATAKYPFNAWEVNGQLNEDFIPTRKFEQDAHIVAMKEIGQIFQEAALLDANDPAAVQLITKGFALQKAHLDHLQATGQIDLSGIIYVNQNGLRPSATPFQEQQGVGMFSQELFKLPRFKMTFVPFTNIFTGYVSADMSVQADPELVDGQGNDIMYGVHSIGDSGKRTGIRQEAKVYDGQGNEVRTKINLVNAMQAGSPGFVDRAATLQKVLNDTTPHLTLIGNASVRFNKRNNNPDSEAIVFAITVDEYIAMPLSANVPKRTQVSTDDLEFSDVAFDGGSVIVEDQGLEAPTAGKREAALAGGDDELDQPQF